MRTIGRKVPEDRPHGDFVSVCDYCGVPRYRSQLTRDGAGLLRCEDEGDGPSATEQLEGNAEKALAWAGKQADMAQRVYDGRPFEFVSDSGPDESEAASNLVFGTLPAARAIWWPGERITSAFSGAMAIARQEDSRELVPLWGDPGRGGKLDEDFARSVARGRKLSLYSVPDQSGYAYPTPSSGADLISGGGVAGSLFSAMPILHDPGDGGIQRLGSSLALKFDGVTTSPQSTKPCFRKGNDTGSASRWDPAYTVNLSGDADFTLAWLGLVRDDGLGFGSARYIQLIGELLGLSTHGGCGMSAVDPSASSSMLDVTLGPDVIPGSHDQHKRYSLSAPHGTPQHFVLEHVSGAGTWASATRLWQNGVLQTSYVGGSSTQALALAPSSFGAVTIGCSAYQTQLCQCLWAGSIIWAQTLSDEQRSVLFSELDARRQ